MKKLFYIIIFFLLSYSGFSQRSEVDRLRSAYAQAVTDSSRCRIAAELSVKFYSINTDSAIYFARQGLKLAGSIEDPLLEFRCLAALGDAFSERDIPESMQAYYNAFRLAKKINYRQGIAFCYYNIGLLNFYLGNSRFYIENLKKAKGIYKELHLDSLAADCDSEIGENFISVNTDSARHYLSLSIADPSQRQNPFLLYYWGRLESRENPQKARAFFEKSIQISKRNQDLRTFCLASRWYSVFHELHGRLDSSISIAKKGLEAARQLNFPRGIMQLSTQLSGVYDKLHKTDSAYKYLQIMVAARNEILSQDKINRIQATVIEEQQRIQALQEEKTALQNRIRLYIALAIAFVVLLFALFFYRNQRKIQRSNRLLQKQRNEINEKNTSLQVSLDTLKATQAQLIQSEKMASLGELTAGIAHEIQNPLNFVNNFSEVNSELIEEANEELNKGNTSEVKTILNDIKENEQKINHHGKRADAIVKGMLQHSSSSKGVKEPTDINALCDEYLRLSYHGLRAKDKTFNATLKTDFDESIGNINIIPPDIGRVVLNLINNAFYAVDARRNESIGQEKKKQNLNGYEPTVSVSTKKIDGKVEITVTDNGNGIPQKVLDKIFQPFFTTKPTGQGTGLGLSLSYDIVKAHGGEIKVATQENKGTEFIIQLPFV